MSDVQPPNSPCPLCPLCNSAGGILLAQTPAFRVIRALEPAFPATYRVVWQTHTAEFSDLSAADQALCMQTVAAVERLMRQHLQPTKINLAALGNFVPHLHWHIIARFDWDSHYPQAVWAAAERAVDETLKAKLATLQTQLPELDAALKAAFSQAS